MEIERLKKLEVPETVGILNQFTKKVLIMNQGLIWKGIITGITILGTIEGNLIEKISLRKVTIDQIITEIKIKETTTMYLRDLTKRKISMTEILTKKRELEGVMERRRLENLINY